MYSIVGIVYSHYEKVDEDGHRLGRVIKSSAYHSYQSLLYGNKLACFTLIYDVWKLFFELENINTLNNAILCATNNNKISERLNFKYIKEYCPEIFYKNYMHVYQSLL